jgi:hypothetical protein
LSIVELRPTRTAWAEAIRTVVPNPRDTRSWLAFDAFTSSLQATFGYRNVFIGLMQDAATTRTKDEARCAREFDVAKFAFELDVLHRVILLLSRGCAAMHTLAESLRSGCISGANRRIARRSGDRWLLHRQTNLCPRDLPLRFEAIGVRMQRTRTTCVAADFVKVPGIAPRMSRDEVRRSIRTWIRNRNKASRFDDRRERRTALETIAERRRDALTFRLDRECHAFARKGRARMHDFDEANTTCSFASAANIDHAADDFVRAREETPSEEPDEDRREQNENRNADGEIADTEKNL